MNEKYIVVADTYRYSDGCFITIFGVFDTEQEAIDFIIVNPTPEISTECTGLWDDKEMKEKHYFDFFKYQGDLTKEECAKRYIKKFDGAPLLVGQYSE